MIEVDAEKLFDRYARRALRSKSHQATACDGGIKVRAINVEDKPIRRKP